MAKFIIRIERQDKLIDEAFDKMELHGFRKAQARVFKAVYKSRLKGFYHTIRTALSKYRAQDGEHFFEAEMEGEVEEMEFQKKKFESFIYGSEQMLKDKNEYKKFNSDRIIQRARIFFVRNIKTTKSKAVKQALGKGTVLEFLNSIHLSISWRIEL